MLVSGVSVMHTVEEQAAIDHAVELNIDSPGCAVVQSRPVKYGPWEGWDLVMLAEGEARPGVPS